MFLLKFNDFIEKGRECVTAVVSRQTLRDGAHADTVHSQHREHLQLRHALVVWTSGHGEDSLVHSGGHPDLSKTSDLRGKYYPSALLSPRPPERPLATSYRTNC